MTRSCASRVAGDELDTLQGALERERGYVAWKCAGLTSAGLQATLGPSTMTLGGLASYASAGGQTPGLRRLHMDMIGSTRGTWVTPT